MYQQYMNQIQSTLSYLSSDELKELLNNDDELEKRVDEALKSLEAEKETMMNMNRVLAEENIAQEPKLIELKAIVNELSDEGKSLLSQVQDKINDYKTKSNNISQDTALALLQSAAAEAEDESEKIYQQFLDKDIASIDTFLDQFIVSRKKMHERKLKADKMIELMRNQSNRNSSFFNPSNVSSGGLPYPSSGGAVPYPIGPAGMPMPGLPHYRPPY